MSLEVTKGLGIAAAGLGLAITLGALIGVGVNGHVFAVFGMPGQYVAPALAGTVGETFCIVIMARGAYKAKKAWDEYQASLGKDDTHKLELL